MPTPIDYAYVAGLIDGEGSIFACIDGRNRGRLYLRAWLIISMASEDVLTWCSNTFGGGLQFVKARHEGWKDQWRWRPTIEQTVIILTECLPYLKVKKR